MRTPAPGWQERLEPALREADELLAKRARARTLTAQVVVRLTPALLRAVERDAQENGRTVSQTIRLAVARHLEADADPVALD